MTLPVKPINEIEEKSEVGLDDKILILDADTEEARLASKDELKGDKGDQGDPGTPGAAATITVGTTSTGAAGTPASVTNSGTSSAAIFNFTIPKGDKGDQGNPGQDGQDGADGNGITSVTSSKVGKTTTVTMNFDEGDPYTFQVEDGADGVGGDVFGPSSSTDGHLVVFDGATGKSIKDGGAMPTIPTNVSDLTNDSGFITGINSGDVTTALGYTPADSASLGTAATKNTGTSSGNVPVLDSDGKLANSTLPGVALTDTFTVSTSSDLTSLSSAEQGDLAIVTSENKTYVLSQAPYSTASNWKQILSPTGGVTSVNGQTGAVTLTIPTDTGDLTNGAGYLTSSTGVTTVNGSHGAVTVQAVLNQLTSAQIKTGTATTDSSVTASALAGAVPVLSTQANNLLTSGMKIWVGTQANYDALDSYDNSTAYLTI